MPLSTGKMWVSLIPSSEWKCPMWTTRAVAVVARFAVEADAAWATRRTACMTVPRAPRSSLTSMRIPIPAGDEPLVASSDPILAAKVLGRVKTHFRHEQLSESEAHMQALVAYLFMNNLAVFVADNEQWASTVNIPGDAWPQNMGPPRHKTAGELALQD